MSARFSPAAHMSVMQAIFGTEKQKGCIASMQHIPHGPLSQHHCRHHRCGPHLRSFQPAAQRQHELTDKRHSSALNGAHLKRKGHTRGCSQAGCKAHCAAAAGELQGALAAAVSTCSAPPSPQTRCAAAAPWPAAWPASSSLPSTTPAGAASAIKCTARTDTAGTAQAVAAEQLQPVCMQYTSTKRHAIDLYLQVHHPGSTNHATAGGLTPTAIGGRLHRHTSCLRPSASPSASCALAPAASALSGAVAASLALCPVLRALVPGSLPESSELQHSASPALLPSECRACSSEALPSSCCRAMKRLGCNAA